MKLLIDLQYLPCVAYFTLLSDYDEIMLESNEYFVRQTYRNRASILGANKVENLIVPVKDASKKIIMKDVFIDYNENWQVKHWRTITAAYNKSPFFEYFEDNFRKVFEKKYVFLWDWNFELLTICLEILRKNKTIRLTEKYDKKSEISVFDARNLINPKKADDLQKFFQPTKYQQNFGSEFVPNLSILDLIFCQGNRVNEILKKSATN